MNKWYKFLSEAVENKKSLNEISKNQLQQSRMHDFLEEYPPNQFDKLFDGKNRFTIPIESGEEVIAQKSYRDQQMLQYINDLRKDGWTIDFSEPFGYASKIITSEYGGKTFQNKRKMKIGPLISALGETAKEFWEKNNKFYTTKENEFYFATKYMIVISRAPIDILRMSDHDGWTSCHSTGGSYFKCAIEESVTGGAVSYIVKEKDLEGIDLNADEIFNDKDRGIVGVSPLSRVRIRRYVGRSGMKDLELAVPEERTYGQNFPGFVETISKYILDAQKDVIDEVKKRMADRGERQLMLSSWNLAGGSYEDTSGNELFREFFGTEFDIYGSTGKERGVTENANLEREVADTIRVWNQRYSHVDVSANVEEYDVGSYSINVHGSVSVELEGNFGITNSVRNLRNIASEMNDKFYLIDEYGMNIQYYAVGNTTEFTFYLKSEDTPNDADELDSWCREVRSEIDSNYDELKDRLIEVLMNEGYMSNPLSEIEARLDEAELQNADIRLEDNYVNADFLESKKSRLKFTIDLKEYFIQISRNIEPTKVTKITDEFLNKMSEIERKVNTELKNEILNSFFLPRKEKQPLVKQRSLFNEQIVNEQVRNTLADNWIEFSSKVYGSYLGNQKISFEFSLGTNIEIRSGKLKSDKSADIFVVLVKHIDKKWPQIVQAFRNKILEIPGEAWKEIQESIQAASKKAADPGADQYRRWSNYNQQDLPETPRVYESKKKKKSPQMFKFDGSNWWILK